MNLDIERVKKPPQTLVAGCRLCKYYRDEFWNCLGEKKICWAFEKRNEALKGGSIYDELLYLEQETLERGSVTEWHVSKAQQIMKCLGELSYSPESMNKYAKAKKISDTIISRYYLEKQ